MMRAPGLAAALRSFCSRVDILNERISWLAAVAVLAACLISAGNAVVRYGWDYSSNAWLEIQWYLFAMTVMLGAPHVLRRNEHVRVDIFYARLPLRWALVADVAGLLLFLLPVMVLLAALSWPVFERALASGEVSSNAGGLIRWPALLLLPLGFGLVALQGVSEIIKRLTRLAAPGEPGADDDLLAHPLRKAPAIAPPGPAPTMRIEYFPPVMFAGLVLIMLLGFPVAFSLAALGLGCAAYAIAMGWFEPVFLVNLPLNIFSILSNDLLLAIPFFTMMGSILEKCGLAEDMLDSMGQLFGTVRGGLGYSVIIVGFILGAITGTVAGQIIAMALIAMPVMIRYGYNLRYTTGVLAASGTITQLVPPSLVLIVLADQLGRPVGDMYKGAWGPSILQVLIFALYTFALGVFRPGHVPGIRRADAAETRRQLWLRCLRGIIPSAVLIFAVLGSMGGLPWMDTAICTPTEAGAMGVVGALLLAALHRRLTWPLVRDSMHGTMRITAMVVFILIGARVFSLVFQGVDGARWIEHQLTGLPGGTVGFLIFVNVFIFFLAFFLDFFEIAFIIIPMIGPVADKMGIDLVWFGVMLCVNMQTSFMHPPFGFALFYLRGIADTLFKEKRIPRPVPSADIYWGALPWVGMQLILVVIVIFVPKSVTIFLDKTQKVDLDKVRIEAPAPAPERPDTNLDELFKRSGGTAPEH